MRYFFVALAFALLASCAGMPFSDGPSVVSLAPVPLAVAMQDIAKTTDRAYKANPVGSIAVVDFQDANVDTKNATQNFKNYFVEPLSKVDEDGFWQVKNDTKTGVYSL